MPNTPKKPAIPRVHPIRPAPQAIDPPERWQLQSAVGFMRFDDSPTGKLVRLADVLRWLEKSRSIPRAEALNVLCSAMPPEIMAWLYWVQPGDYAKPVPVDSTFGYKTAAQIESQKAQDRQNTLQRAHESQQRSWDGFRSAVRVAAGQITTRQPEPTEPGLPALLKLLRHWWTRSKWLRSSTGDILDDPKISTLTNLSIRLDKAAGLWGYGQLLKAVDSEPSSFVELVALRKAQPGLQWTVTMLAILRLEGDKRIKQPHYRKDMAAAIGISGSRIGQLLNKDWEPKRKPAIKLQSVQR